MILRDPTDTSYFTLANTSDDGPVPHAVRPTFLENIWYQLHIFGFQNKLVINFDQIKRY
jgi:hypothetical protein